MRSAPARVLTSAKRTLPQVHRTSMRRADELLAREQVNSADESRTCFTASRLSLSSVDAHPPPPSPIVKTGFLLEPPIVAGRAVPFPRLVTATDHVVRGRGWRPDDAAADVVLPGVGWAVVSLAEGVDARIQTLMPPGLISLLREPLEPGDTRRCRRNAPRQSSNRGKENSAKHRNTHGQIRAATPRAQ